MSGLSSRRILTIRPAIIWNTLLFHPSIRENNRNQKLSFSRLYSYDLKDMGSIVSFPYRTVAEVSLKALVRNLSILRNVCRKEIIPVVKADAYGHGMIQCSRVLVGRGGCQMLAVATLEEAIELRQNVNHQVAILVLSGFLPHQLDAYTKHRLTPMIHSLFHLRSIVGRKSLPEIHLKLDSGMHRLGIPKDEYGEAAKLLEKHAMKLAGVASHFAESESLLSRFTLQQEALFRDQVAGLRARKLLNTDARIHIANSGGILGNHFGETTAVRPGLALFGVSPNPRLPRSGELVPVLEWKTRVLVIKDIYKGDSVGYGRAYKAKRHEKIAILPIGYADGYPRLFSNEGKVIINGKFCPIRGRVSMDMCAVDVTHATNVREGTLVTLLGESGKSTLTSEELGRWAKTIPYEIFCGLSPRVPRVYLD